MKNDITLKVLTEGDPKKKNNFILKALSVVAVVVSVGLAVKEFLTNTSSNFPKDECECGYGGCSCGKHHASPEKNTDIPNEEFDDAGEVPDTDGAE